MFYSSVQYRLSVLEEDCRFLYNYASLNSLSLSLSLSLSCSERYNSVLTCAHTLLHNSFLFFLFFVCCGPNGREVSYLSKLGLPLAWQPSFPPRLSLDKMSIAVSSSIIAVPSGISQTPFAFTNKVFFQTSLSL